MCGICLYAKEHTNNPVQVWSICTHSVVFSRKLEKSSRPVCAVWSTHPQFNFGAHSRLLPLNDTAVKRQGRNKLPWIELADIFFLWLCTWMFRCLSLLDSIVFPLFILVVCSQNAPSERFVQNYRKPKTPSSGTKSILIHLFSVLVYYTKGALAESRSRQILCDHAVDLPQIRYETIKRVRKDTFWRAVGGT